MTVKQELSQKLQVAAELAWVDRVSDRLILFVIAIVAAMIVGSYHAATAGFIMQLNLCKERPRTLGATCSAERDNVRRDAGADSVNIKDALGEDRRDPSDQRLSRSKQY